MKKPEEIKKGIEKCLSDVPCCYECPYAGKFVTGDKCVGELKADALEYIAQLEERVAIMTEGGTPKTRNVCFKNNVRIFACEVCGYGINDIYIKDEGKYGIEPDYCPNCGRRVENHG